MKSINRKDRKGIRKDRKEIKKDDFNFALFA
jgi:hypothetical protein